MAEPADATHYTTVAAAFHWAIALLILITTGLALFRETFGPYAVAMISAHKVLGLSILLLGLARLGWRLAHPPPPFPAHVGRLERLVANTVHRLLYGLMIAVPLAGWLFVSLAPASRPLDFRGHESVPDLPLRPDDEASFFGHEIHELLGFAMIGVFLLHLAGVARHQFLCRTDIVDRMAGTPPRRRTLAAAIGVAVLLWAVGMLLDFLGVRFWD